MVCTETASSSRASVVALWVLLSLGVVIIIVLIALTVWFKYVTARHSCHILSVPSNVLRLRRLHVGRGKEAPVIQSLMYIG